MPDLRERLQGGLADRYRLERELGRGGMATVFLALDLRHERPVALKVLHPELAAALGPERFLREVKLAARLQHPHILSVHDSGEADGLLWFTMPFVEGESLRDRLRHDKQLPIEEAIRVINQAGQALHYAHQHGVIHRDIKPENLLLTSDGNTEVADFGVARALSGGGDERLTETGLAVGTPAYMSPEQATAERELDARTDVYSLACVLYEMLAGEPPYTGPTAQAIIAKRLTEPVPHLRTLREVPEVIELAVTKALARSPADRFQTMAEFLAALGAPSVPSTTLSGTLIPSKARDLPRGFRNRRLDPFAVLRAGSSLRSGRGGFPAPGGNSAHKPAVISVMTNIELGLDTFGDVTADAAGRLLPQAHVLRDVMAEAELADRVGVDFFGVGEHHRPDFAISAPEVLLAAIAARTQRIRLGTAVTVLSTDDPVRVYQRFSTLNAVSNGRAEVILGRGSFTESFPLFGYSLEDYDDLFEEKLAIFAALRDADRTGQTVRWKGTVRPPLEGVRVYPPVERPPLSTWVGVGGSPESVVRAARYGFPLTLAIIGGDPRRFRPYVELYHRTLAQLGHGTLPIGIHSPGHIAETDSQAREELWPAHQVMRNRIGAERGWGPTSRAEFDHEIAAGSLYVGSPETVAHKIAATVQALGASRFDLKYSAGTLEHDPMLRSIELYGREVMPRVRELLRERATPAERKVAASGV